MDSPEISPDISQAPDEESIRQALQQAGCGPRPPPPRMRTGHKVVIGAYVLALLALGAVLYLIGAHAFDLRAGVRSEALRLVRAAMFAVLVLAAAKLVDALLIGRVEDDASRYNLTRLLRLVVVVVVALLAVSVVFRTWYTALVSLGVVSAVLGFALQAPLSSFIGWIYILVKSPYQVGDRIEMGDATGDVIAIGYLDTTLWEFGGPYLSTDHPSGRLIKIPNSNVLDTPVFNYSWPLFPYIWNEIDVQVAYGSDLQWVAETMRRVVTAEMGETMEARIDTYRRLLDRTPVDQLEVRDHPTVLFRVSENTWVEAVVRYLVDPRRAGTVKSQLTAKIVAALNQEPERVMFPKGPNR